MNKISEHNYFSGNLAVKDFLDISEHRSKLTIPLTDNISAADAKCATVRDYEEFNSWQHKYAVRNLENIGLSSYLTQLEYDARRISTQAEIKAYIRTMTEQDKKAYGFDNNEERSLARILCDFEVDKKSKVFLGFKNKKLTFTPLSSLFCRAYHAMFTSHTTINHSDSTSQRHIKYRICLRTLDYKKILRRRFTLEKDVYTMKMEFAYSEELREYFHTYARQFNNFQERIIRGDFCAVLEHLAKMVGLYAAGIEITAKDMAAGQTLEMTSVNTSKDSAGISSTVLFVPYRVSTQTSNAIFSAIVLAANATGTPVVTDWALVDQTTNATMLSTYSGITLAEGCYNAMRLIMCLLNECKAGTPGAFAITKGLHSVLTVVGHTNEGAYMRRVLRQGRFAPSYGALYSPDRLVWNGLPRILTGQRPSIMSAVDQILLVTAALSCLADPQIDIDGKLYPTHSSSCHKNVDVDTYANDITEDILCSNEGNTQDALFHARNIAVNCSAFCCNYSALLSKVFFTVDGQNSVAVSLAACFSSMVGRLDRHLCYKIISPYYWIEPTSLFKHKFACAANDCGNGVIVGTSDVEKPTMNMFEFFDESGIGTRTTYINATFRNARTCGLILHHETLKNNGLSAVQIWQMNHNQLMNSGLTGLRVSDAIYGTESIGNFLWKRGDCGLPPPAEMVYTGKGIVVRLTHMEPKPDLAYDDSSTNIFLPSELFNTYKFEVSPPEAVDYLVPAGKRVERQHVTYNAAAKACNHVQNRILNCGAEARIHSFAVGAYTLQIPRMDYLEGTTEVQISEHTETQMLGDVHRGATRAHTVFDTAIRPRPMTTRGRGTNIPTFRTNARAVEMEVARGRQEEFNNGVPMLGVFRRSDWTRTDAEEPEVPATTNDDPNVDSNTANAEPSPPIA